MLGSWFSLPSHGGFPSQGGNTSKLSHVMNIFDSDLYGKNTISQIGVS